MLSKDWRSDDWVLHVGHGRGNVLIEKGQGELTGSIRCTWIPFILVVTSQSHRLPLSLFYSADPLVDPKTHTSINTIELFFVMILTITSYHTFISWSWWFYLLSAPLWFCCLHTLYWLSISKVGVLMMSPTSAVQGDRSVTRNYQKYWKTHISFNTDHKNTQKVWAWCYIAVESVYLYFPPLYYSEHWGQQNWDPR